MAAQVLLVDAADNRRGGSHLDEPAFIGFKYLVRPQMCVLRFNDHCTHAAYV